MLILWLGCVSPSTTSTTPAPSPPSPPGSSSSGTNEGEGSDPPGPGSVEIWTQVLEGGYEPLVLVPTGETRCGKLVSIARIDDDHVPDVVVVCDGEPFTYVVRVWSGAAALEGRVEPVGTPVMPSERIMPGSPHWETWTATTSTSSPSAQRRGRRTGAWCSPGSSRRRPGS